MSDTTDPGDVVSLDERREAKTGPGYAECGCGSGWFRLLRQNPDTGMTESGAVTLTPDGQVAGWSGFWVCFECGNPL